MLGLFENDDDKLVYQVQQQTFVEFIDMMLKHYCIEMSNAEFAVGKKSDIQWRENQIYLQDFEEFYHILSAIFRYENYGNKYKQNDLFKDKENYRETIFKDWSSWFKNFLESSSGIYIIKEILFLAQVSSDTMKYQINNSSKINQAKLELIQKLDETQDGDLNLEFIYKKIIKNKVDNIKYLKKKETAFKIIPKKKLVQCKCTESGKDPCNVTPCLTLCSISASKGIFLE